jgi:hypothetical protein
MLLLAANTSKILLIQNSRKAKCKIDRLFTTEQRGKYLLVRQDIYLMGCIQVLFDR